MRHTIRFGLLLSLTALTPIANAADFSRYSGEQLFQRLCASCHGATAQGDGPVAASLKVAVPNLREISKRNHGEFPAAKIQQIIDGRLNLSPHGTRLMPVWGDELLRSEAGDPEAEQAAAELMHKIVDYLRNIQGMRPAPAAALQ